MGEEEIVPASPVISSAKRRGARRHARVRGRSKEGREGRGSEPSSGETDSSGAGVQEEKRDLVEEVSGKKVKVEEAALEGVEELPVLEEERSTGGGRGGGSSTIQWTESLDLEVRRCQLYIGLLPCAWIFVLLCYSV